MGGLQLLQSAAQKSGKSVPPPVQHGGWPAVGAPRPQQRPACGARRPHTTVRAYSGVADSSSATSLTERVPASCLGDVLARLQGCQPNLWAGIPSLETTLNSLYHLAHVLLALKRGRVCKPAASQGVGAGRLLGCFLRLISGGARFQAIPGLGGEENPTPASFAQGEARKNRSRQLQSGEARERMRPRPAC